MSPASHNPVDSQLQQRREEIRRSLSRVNTAGVAVVLVTIALAIAAAIGAMRAARQTQIARDANERGREELWKSYLAQAHAGRLSRVIGSRAAGLDAITAAAAIRPSVDLRNEAIAHLAMFDFEPTSIAWTNVPNIGHTIVDPTLERLFESDGRGNIRISRIPDRTNAFLLRGTNATVHFASFSADGSHLSAVHSNRRLVVWNLDGRTNAYSLTDVTWARFSPRLDLLLAVRSDDSVRMLEGRTGRELASFKPGGRPSTAAFDSTDDEVAVAVQNKLHLWNWRTDARREPFETDQNIWSVAWNDHLLAASESSGEVRVWNLRTKRSRRLPAHQNASNHLFFNPAGDLLVSTSYDGSTKVWEPRTGELLLSTSEGFASQFSPDGQRLLFSTQSGRSIWRVVRPVGITTLNCASGTSMNVWHVDFSRNGRWLAATKDDSVSIFEVASGRRIARQSMNRSRSAYFLPGDTNLLVTSTHRIGFWPFTEEEGTSNNAPAFRFGKRELIPLTNISYLEPGALSVDRRRLVLPVSQSEAALFDLEARRELLRFTNAILPKMSSLSPDGRWVVTGTFHGWGMTAWDAVSGAKLHDFKDGNSSAYFSPDGRFLVNAGASHYRIYEPGSWKLLHQIPRESGSDLANLAAFDRDGRLMAAIKQLNRVELLAPGSWNLVASLIPPDQQVVTWPAFSADGQHLAVATSQDLVQLWNLKSLRAGLARLGLDWDSTRPDAAPVTPVRTPFAAGDSWLTQLLLPVSVGVLVVLACAVFIRQRQRQLISAYMEIDQFAEEQKRQLTAAQTELVHSQKMKALGTLAAGIAHDFNNLLSVIRMSNQLTGTAAKDSPDIQENVSEVEQAVQQGKKLVRSMLGYSREEIGEQGPFGLPELVEDTVALLSKQFLSGIALTLELDRDTSLIRGSRNRLEQILLNLIVNAAEAMEGSGTLHIGVRQITSLPERLVLRPKDAGAYLELAIADSGPGIAPEILPRIFEPFYTTKHRGVVRGTGLGLSTVYTMAEQDGLGITVDSRPESGARFSIFIPITAGMRV
jgi:signal transduction histidine kinase